MNVDDNIKAAGIRLARDMRAIRTARSVSHDAIVRVTKAAPNVLEEFERTALVGNPMYNRVYLRLFMRGYAEVIGIRTDDALRAADEMLQGTYTDRLARLYLESYEEEAPEEEAQEADAAGSDALETKKGETEPVSDIGPGKAPSESQPPAQSAAKTKVESSAPGTGGRAVSDKQPTTRAEAQKTQQPVKAPAAPSTSAPSTSSANRGPGIALARGAVAGIAGFAVVALVALAVWFLWPDTVETTAILGEVPTTDTVRVQVPQLPPRIVLGDTTSFFVIAARDTLNPIRVTPDDGIRAPHWIELGDSMEFRIANQLVLEMRLNAVDVSVHDVLLPTDGRDAARRLVLTKEFAQAYLDSLRAAGGAVGTAGSNE